MSPSARSSSGSWSGGGGGRRPVDIIDLDRYIRGAVRPNAPQPRRRISDRERLVVDAGKAARGGGGATDATSSASGGGGGAVCRDRARDKRYSQDSGLSDGSYVRRKHKDIRQKRGGALRDSSANSMRTFRATYERALRDQQKQITRVAEICERLAVSRGGGGGGGAPQSVDSSELSSTTRSRSSRDPVRKDRLRTGECKTYKIINSKLDELMNRLNVSRARPPAPPAAALLPAAPPHAPHAPAGQAPRRQLVERGAGGSRSAHALPPPAAPAPPPPPPPPPPPATRRPARLAARRALQIDIAPHDALPTLAAPLAAPLAPEYSPRARRSGSLNVANESSSPLVAAPPATAPPAAGPARRPRPCGTTTCWQHTSIVASASAHYESSTDPGSGSGCCRFDLDDPVRVYAQARRARAVRAQGSAPAAGAGAGPAAGRSLCSLCRSYWRALRRCLAGALPAHT